MKRRWLRALFWLAAAALFVVGFPMALFVGLNLLDGTPIEWSEGFREAMSLLYLIFGASATLSLALLIAFFAWVFRFFVHHVWRTPCDTGPGEGLCEGLSALGMRHLALGFFWIILLRSIPMGWLFAFNLDLELGPGGIANISDVIMLSSLPLGIVSTLHFAAAVRRLGAALMTASEAPLCR